MASGIGAIVFEWVASLVAGVPLGKGVGRDVPKKDQLAISKIRK